jgi:hypothetical protein
MGNLTFQDQPEGHRIFGPCSSRSGVQRMPLKLGIIPWNPTLVKGSHRPQPQLRHRRSHTAALVQCQAGEGSHGWTSFNGGFRASFHWVWRRSLVIMIYQLFLTQHMSQCGVSRLHSACQNSSESMI